VYYVAFATFDSILPLYAETCKQSSSGVQPVDFFNDNLSRKVFSFLLKGL
jgi:hypothetical protein